MKQKDTIHLHGNLLITVWDASTPALEQAAREDRGIVLKKQRSHNLVVLAGRNAVRDAINGDGGVSVAYFAIGLSAAAVLDGDTALGTEVLRNLITQRVKTSSVWTAKYFLSSGSLNGSTLAEAGLFMTASGPPMFARALITPAIAKDASRAITFQWATTLAGV